MSIPSSAQQLWQDMELGAFIHYGPCTYDADTTHRGQVHASLINPVAFDARQWVGAARAMGASYLMMVAKHHDGFCLWPTKTTDYSIASSPWRQGQGDMVREVADACAAEELHFGLYLSPWDCHAACYNDPAAYDDYYAQQLTELLTGYGPLSELWFDGAGSAGRTYDWPRMMALAQRYQPDAMIFNMGRPTIRWAGNEKGVTAYPCWNTTSLARELSWTDDWDRWLPNTREWLPAECDASLRKAPVWFWEPDTDARLLSFAALMETYHLSVGHGANLLMNLSPARDGLIPEPDVQLVQLWGQEIAARYGQPFASTKGIKAQHVVALRFPRTIVDRAIVMEDIGLGEPIRDWTLEVLTGERDGRPAWRLVYEGSAMGHKHIVRFVPAECTGMRLRIRMADEPFRVRSLAAFSCI